MKKSKKFKVKYVYIEPKIQEEKIQQQQILDEVYDDIFDRILNRKINE